MSLGDIIPKRSHYRGRYTYGSPPTDLNEGDWWYDTTHRIFKWYIRGETRWFPCIVTYLEQDFTIPIGGGAASGTVTIAGLTVAWLISAEVMRCVPQTHDIYSPIIWQTSTLNVFGVTLGSHSTGTTATLRVTAYGHLV